MLHFFGGFGCFGIDFNIKTPLKSDSIYGPQSKTEASDEGFLHTALMPAGPHAPLQSTTRLQLLHNSRLQATSEAELCVFLPGACGNQ